MDERVLKKVREVSVQRDCLGFLLEGSARRRFTAIERATRGQRALGFLLRSEILISELGEVVVTDPVIPITDWSCKGKCKIKRNAAGDWDAEILSTEDCFPVLVARASQGNLFQHRRFSVGSDHLFLASLRPERECPCISGGHRRIFLQCSEEGKHALNFRCRLCVDCRMSVDCSSIFARWSHEPAREPTGRFFQQQTSSRAAACRIAAVCTAAATGPATQMYPRLRRGNRAGIR